MAYFSGKVKGILGQIECASAAHSKALEAAAELIEKQMAKFTRAYRD